MQVEEAKGIDNKGAETLFNGTQPEAIDPDSAAEGGADAAVNNTKVTKPLYEGIGFTANTTEELVEYTKNLETQAVQSRLAAERRPSPQPTMDAHRVETPAPIDPNEQVNIEELLFSNPKKAISLIKEDAKADIRKELNAKDQEKSFWNKFYDEHPDLRNQERVVQSITREKWEEVSKLPVGRASEYLAKESRTMISQIRGEAGKKVEVQRATAGALPSGGGNTPPPVVAQDESTTFVAELRKMRAKRKA